MSRSETPGHSLQFFEEFRELAERSTYARTVLGSEAVGLSNPVCGDRVSVAVEVEGGRIVSYGYQVQGCWPVRGCLELMGDLLLEHKVEQALGLRLERWLSLVEGVPASKRHAFSLVYRATLKAVALASSSEVPRRISVVDAPLREENPAQSEA